MVAVAAGCARLGVDYLGFGIFSVHAGGGNRHTATHRRQFYRSERRRKRHQFDASFRAQPTPAATGKTQNRRTQARA